MGRFAWVLDTVARVAAGCLGLFTALNILGAIRFGVDATLWWVDLRWLPSRLRLALFAGLALALVQLALRPPSAGLRRRATGLLVAGFGAACLLDAATLLLLRAQGRVAGPWFPLSFATAAILALILAGLLRSKTPVRAPRWGRPLAAGATLALLTVAFPLGQMTLFGRSDYRRPADAVVVFGSRVYSDGRPSDALADRMRTAVELVQGGWAPILIVSGGPGDGPFHETEAMRAFAEASGVPPGAIREDRSGWSTQDAVEATVALMREEGLERLLAVSHAYHLPRVELCYHWAGVDAATVPARESYRLTAMPRYMAREVAAFWVYWGRGVLGV